MALNEDQIRDALSTRLDVLESGLRLIKPEQFLPNPQGTRGFVDLFAQDQAGKYVIVELKRSAAASREALHEVLKYLEAIKVNFGARDAEIRIFIVSTDWSELLVPFSSFVKRTSCEVTGYLLEFEDGDASFTARKITPIDLAQDRLFAPWHELNLYESEDSLANGVKSYEMSCSAKGIDNFVLVTMTPQPDHHQRSVEAVKSYISNLHQSMGSASEQEHPSDVADKMPEYKYLLYFASLQLREEQCLEAIRSILSRDDFKEFKSDLNGLNEDERLCEVHTKLYEIDPEILRDHYEIGYPAKFGRRLLDEEKWTIVGIRRYGALKANSALTDEAIINDIKGDDGENCQTYRRSFVPSNNAELTEVRMGVKRCLRNNLLWRNQILRVLDDFLPSDPTIAVNLSVFNPANFCLSLYQFLTQDTGVEYIPSYILEVRKSEQPVVVIFGAMCQTGIAPSFKGVLDKHFDGSGIGLLQSLSWGGYLSHDVDIAEDLGMTYKTFKVDLNDGHRQFQELKEVGWRPHAAINPVIEFQRYVEHYKEFIQDVVEFYSSQWDGVMWTYDQTLASRLRT